MTVLEPELTTHSPGRARRMLAALRREAGPLEYLALAFVCVLGIAAVFPGALSPASPFQQSLLHSLLGPSADQLPDLEGLLGRDNLGRDQWSRIVHGARYSIGIGLGASMLGAIVGLMLGLTAGWVGGLVDAAVVRLADLIMSVPTILMGLLVLSFAQASAWMVALVLGIAVAPLFVRMVRAETLRVRNEGYIESAVALGASSPRIVLSHILPNVAPVLITVMLVEIAPLILAEASLSYLGVGVQAPPPAGGAMLQDGTRFVHSAWWLTVFPGLVLTVTVLSLSIVGYWLRRAYDPRRRRFR